MKKTLLNMVMALGAVAMLSACGGGSGTTTVVGNTICNLVQVAVAETNMTVGVTCTSDKNITTASLTADGVVKTPVIAGASIDDNITFVNLQTGTVYPVVLDVVAGVDIVSTTLNVTTAISTPTIAMASQTVNDNGGFVSTALPAPTVTGVVAGAVYSLPTNPTGGMLTINASTGVATWNGNLGGSTSYNITIKVVNPDGGQSTVSFTLNVVDNL